MSIKDAFFEICRCAERAKGHYVSLYVRVPRYGGPEEGGWWTSDVELVASQRFDSRAKARAVEMAIRRLAEEMTRDAQKSYGEYCLRTCEWLDARGLDADYLPEPDGPEEYFVVVERRAGSSVSQGAVSYS